MSAVFRPTLLDAKQDSHGCSEQLASLVRRCWSEDVVERPDFGAVKSAIKRISKSVVLTRCLLCTHCMQRAAIPACNDCRFSNVLAKNSRGNIVAANDSVRWKHVTYSTCVAVGTKDASIVV